MKISSQAFSNGEKIPEKYTSYGENRIPPIHLEDIPEKARSLALTVDDPDATRGTFNHWVLFNVDPKVHDIKENCVPVMATQGRNDFGEVEYRRTQAAFGRASLFFQGLRARHGPAAGPRQQEGPIGK